MAGPIAPGGPVPPPVINLPWGSVGAGGQVFLNPQSFEFLQWLWSALQGGSTFYVDLTCSEDIGSGKALNVWNDAGSFHLRHADCTSAITDPRDMHGFSRQAYASGQTARMWVAGVMTGISATLLPGYAYLGAAGALSDSPNGTAGQINQIVGVAVGQHSLSYQPQPATGT
jgi:hypothetical protein